MYKKRFWKYSLWILFVAVMFLFLSPQLVCNPFFEQQQTSEQEKELFEEELFCLQDSLVSTYSIETRSPEYLYLHQSPDLPTLKRPPKFLI